MSPLLILIVLDNMQTKMKDNSPRGIRWNLVTNKRLEDLEYADDICLLSTTLSDMQDKIDAIVHELSKVGLKVNSSKTKFIILKTDTSTPEN